MRKPIYRLRELMYEKYGEERFALACEIVARWLKHECKWSEAYSAEYVANMCNAQVNFGLTREAGEALKGLFGLKSVEELFH